MIGIEDNYIAPQLKHLQQPQKSLQTKERVHITDRMQILKDALEAVVVII